MSGIVLLSDASDGRLLAELDAGALTALRTGAAAVLAAEVLGSGDGRAAVIRCGVNGRAVARTFLARGRDVLLWDADAERTAVVAEERGGSRRLEDQALAAEAVVTVTPGREILFAPGSLRAGQHVSLMGADGPGKAELAVEELGRARVVVDEWEQASHNGDISRAVESGILGRDGVVELGRILTGEEHGRERDDDITVFDSTGLAVQDLPSPRSCTSAGGRSGEQGVRRCDRAAGRLTYGRPVRTDIRACRGSRPSDGGEAAAERVVQFQPAE